MGRRRREPNHLPGLIVAAGALALTLGYGCSNDAEDVPEGLCNPGESIFCRCEGGDPGTKECKDDGQSFGDCGPCDPRPTTGPAQQSSSSSGGFGGAGLGGPGAGPANGGAGGDGGAIVGTEPLLAPCTDNAQCQSGLCVFNYCTIPCEVVSECPYPQSECVPFDASTTICMPTCSTALDCAPFTAPPSRCGFAQAVDNWGVTVCAEWGDNHQLMPEGTDCLPFDHPACNLGYQQMQIVCTEQGVCATGCFVNNDCPQGAICSGGSCQ